MKIENTKAQMRKGILEYCILSILKQKEAYPSEVVEILKASELMVVEGTIYPLLTRLKNAEVLSYRWEESSSGPPRKYYKLTKKGEQMLEQMHETWVQLQSAINLITSKNDFQKLLGHE